MTETCWCGYETADRLGADGRAWGPACRAAHGVTTEFASLPNRRARRLAAPVGYVGRNHPETAQAMQAKALLTAGTLRTRIAWAVASSLDGMTDYEMEDAGLGEHQSVSAARRSLVLTGHVEVALSAYGAVRTRCNCYGNEAQVWVATARCREELARLG